MNKDTGRSGEASFNGEWWADHMRRNLLECSEHRLFWTTICTVPDGSSLQALWLWLLSSYSHYVIEEKCDDVFGMHLVCFQSLVCYSHCVSNNSVSDDTFSNHTHEMPPFVLFFLLLLIRSSSSEAHQYGYSWSLWMGCSDMRRSLCWKSTVPECLEELNEVDALIIFPVHWTSHTTFRLMVVNSKIAVIP